MAYTISRCNQWFEVLLPATGSFPSAADVSAQGMAGLNQEGSISQQESGPDFSDSLMGN